MENQSQFVLINPKDRPDYRELIAPVSEAVWPEFMFHDAISNQHWDDLFERFPEYQFALWDSERGRVVGIGNSVPLAWDGEAASLPDEGWDWALTQSVMDHKAGRKPRTLCGIQISIAPAYQGQGVSKVMVQAMKSVRTVKGLERLIVPVRPSLKSQYPLTPMERYVKWADERGKPFDPWLRVHIRQGGKIVKVCHQAMRIEGRVEEWEEWTGMRFPESGQYVVTGALMPVVIDCEANRGTYVEPNVWVVYEE